MTVPASSVARTMLRLSASQLRSSQGMHAACAATMTTAWPMPPPLLSRHASTFHNGPATTAAAGNPASRPFARHRPDLPHPKSYRLPMALLVLFSALTWSAFTAHATNRERLSSSVLKNIVDKIRDSAEVRQTMGEDVHLKRETWLAGDPWIRGSVNMMQGRVDMSFKIVGSKDSGTVYFSAIRRDAQTPYETLRFLIVLDSNKGSVISLLES